MKELHIKVRPDRLNAPLATCNVGKLSSAVFVIEGDIPDDVDGVTIQIGRTADPETGAARENYTVTARENAADGDTARTFRAYVAPLYFPDVSDALEYHIVALDEQGRPRWLGTGPLIVRDNPANGTVDAPDIIPADTYIRNPVTGLYHKLTATVNEDGEIVTTVESEGIER